MKNIFESLIQHSYYKIKKTISGSKRIKNNFHISGVPKNYAEKYQKASDYKFRQNKYSFFNICHFMRHQSKSGCNRIVIIKAANIK